jgi:hypothetical protein
VNQQREDQPFERAINSKPIEPQAEKTAAHNKPTKIKTCQSSQQRNTPNEIRQSHKQGREKEQGQHQQYNINSNLDK